MTQIHGVILDVDGTLVDSNDAHAKSWADALAEFGYTVPFAKIRPLIGMGGDKVLPEVISVQSTSYKGQKISQRRGEIFKERYLSTVKPFPNAQALLNHMRSQGLKLAIASSAKPDELKSLLQLVGAADLIQEKTSSEEAKDSKPAPESVDVTLQKMGYLPNAVLMIGDTPYDIQAAKKAGVRTIALRSGGWKDADLMEAIAIYTDTADLLEHYDHSPLA